GSNNVVLGLNNRISQPADVTRDLIAADLDSQGHNIGELISGQLVELIDYRDAASVLRDTPQLNGFSLHSCLGALTDASSSTPAMTLADSQALHSRPLARTAAGGLG